MDSLKPKHTLQDKEKFADERAKLGQLIVDGMKTSGGTDIDWVVEHRGGFIVMENKTFNQNRISIPRGQMIAFETLHSRLSNDGKCYFLFFGFDTNMDFKNPESVIWYFDMEEWKNKKIPNEYDTRYKRHLIQRESMKPITIRGYRELIEKYWCEFEEVKISKKTNIKKIVSDFTNQKLQKKILIKKESYMSIQKKSFNLAYKLWTKSDEEIMRQFWNDKSNKESEYAKIRALSKKLGRNNGGITSRLRKMGLAKFEE